MRAASVFLMAAVLASCASQPAGRSTPVSTRQVEANWIEDVRAIVGKWGSTDCGGVYEYEFLADGTGSVDNWSGGYTFSWQMIDGAQLRLERPDAPPWEEGLYGFQVADNELTIVPADVPPMYACTFYRR